VPATVTVTTIKLNRLAAGLSDPAAKFVALKKVGAIYRSFAQQRFSRLSRGGGEWPDLAESTIRGRRKGKGAKKASKKAALTPKKAKKSTEVVKTKRPEPKKELAAQKVSILIDKGMLFAALAPTAGIGQGALEAATTRGIRLGYGGPMKHPDGGVTLADIASFHQSGSDHLPQRKIIVEPDSTTLELMTRHITTWLKTRST
jgi:hypothetical protein